MSSQPALWTPDTYWCSERSRACIALCH
jgi:hypothetical protein